LESGVEKLINAAKDVVMLEANLQIMLVSAEEKRSVSEGIAQTVQKEKDIVEQENAKAFKRYTNNSSVDHVSFTIKKNSASDAFDSAQLSTTVKTSNLALLDEHDRVEGLLRVRSGTYRVQRRHRPWHAVVVFWRPAAALYGCPIHSANGRGGSVNGAMRPDHQAALGDERSPGVRGWAGGADAAPTGARFSSDALTS
jgi:hypothetical protein